MSKIPTDSTCHANAILANLGNALERELFGVFPITLTPGLAIDSALDFFTSTPPQALTSRFTRIFTNPEMYQNALFKLTAGSIINSTCLGALLAISLDCVSLLKDPEIRNDSNLLAQYIELTLVTGIVEGATSSLVPLALLTAIPFSIASTLTVPALLLGVVAATYVGGELRQLRNDSLNIYHNPSNSSLIVSSTPSTN